MQKRSFFITALILVISASLTFAAEFQTKGYKAVSMGGAGVASSGGCYSTYYNPAQLGAHNNSFEISFSAGVGVREINLVEHIDNLSEVDIDATIAEMEAITNSITLSDIQSAIVGGFLPSDSPQLKKDVTIIKRELSAISKKNGLQVMPDINLVVQAGNFGFGFFNMGEATAFGTIDRDRLEFIIEKNYTGYPPQYIKYDETIGVGGAFFLSDQSEYNANSIEAAASPDSTTHLTLSGLVYHEIPVAYGRQFDIPSGKLSIGGALKAISATTYSATIDIDSNTDTIEDSLEASEESETNPGVDIGLLFSPSAMNNLSIGLVGKNINSPEFGTKNGADIEIEPQIRAGVSLNLLEDKITIACDLDLSVNKTYIANYKSQFIGGGISYHPTNFFSLRAGLMQNIQESNEGAVLTAGLGLGIKKIQIDIAAQCSTETGEFDEQKIPRYGKVQLALVSKW